MRLFHEEVLDICNSIVDQISKKSTLEVNIDLDVRKSFDNPHEPIVYLEISKLEVLFKRFQDVHFHLDIVHHMIE